MRYVISLYTENRRVSLLRKGLTKFAFRVSQISDKGNCNQATSRRLEFKIKLQAEQLLSFIDTFVNFIIPYIRCQNRLYLYRSIIA